MSLTPGSNKWRGTISSSKIPTILGLSPFTSPYALWHEMHGDRLPNQGEVGMHLDDDPTNNSIENLRWGTASDNVRDCSAKRRHNKSRNDHCPQGHALAAPNLDPYQLNRGVRMCVACQKAHRYIRRRPHLKPELKRISDGYSDAIAGGEA